MKILLGHSFGREAALTALHCLLFCGIFLLLNHFGQFNAKIDTESLLNWDGNWYYQIKEYGYVYIENSQNNLAFFPLFPIIWKISMLNELGICILNALIFFIAFWMLARHLTLSTKTCLLLLSTPTLFFCFLPYSEAIFYLGGTLLLVGLEKRNFRPIIVGILIAASSRSVALIFPPVLGLLTIPLIIYNQFDAKVVRMLCGSLLCVVLISLLVYLTQFVQTGQWFKLFETQKAWNRSLRFPTLPLTTLGNVLWLDGIALFVCSFALYDYFKLLFKKEYYGLLNWAYLFSLGYLICVCLADIFFSGIWFEMKGTAIWSLNRHIFGTPFFVFYIISFIQNTKNSWAFPKRIDLILIMGLCCLLMGAYATLPGKTSFQGLLMFLLMITYTLFYLKSLEDRFTLICIYIINTTLQAALMCEFLEHGWIG